MKTTRVFSIFTAALLGLALSNPVAANRWLKGGFDSIEECLHSTGMICVQANNMSLGDLFNGGSKLSFEELLKINRLPVVARPEDKVQNTILATIDYIRSAPADQEVAEVPVTDIKEYDSGFSSRKECETKTGLVCMQNTGSVKLRFIMSGDFSEMLKVNNLPATARKDDVTPSGVSFFAMNKKFTVARQERIRAARAAKKKGPNITFGSPRQKRKINEPKLVKGFGSKEECLSKDISEHCVEITKDHNMTFDDITGSFNMKVFLLLHGMPPNAAKGRDIPTGWYAVL